MIDRVESFYYSQDEYQHIVFHSSILLEKIKSKKQVVNQFLIMLVVLFLFWHFYIVRNRNNKVVLVESIKDNLLLLSGVKVTSISEVPS